MSTQDPNDLRDARLDAAWRAASNEEPPATLDDRIRAAARREVKAGPQQSDVRTTPVPLALRPERWWMPLAAAAAIGVIAIGILQLANTDKVVEPAHDKAVVSDIPSTPSSTSRTAPAPAAPSPADGDDARNRVASPAPLPAPAPPSALRKDAASKFASEERAMKSATDAMKPAAPIAPLAEPFPADAKREAEEKTAGPAPPPAEAAASGLAGKLDSTPAPAARDEITRDAQRANAPMAQSAAPAAQAPMRRLQEADASPQTRAKVQPKLAVTDWVALIRKLRDEGKTDDAAKELAAFRAAYPDHERLLPPDLRDWKPVPR